MILRIVDVQIFMVQRDKLCRSLAPFITTYSADEYMQMDTRLYLSSDDQSGFGVTGTGELVSVFSLLRGRGEALVTGAKRCGACHLDCLGEHLRVLYERCGFRVVSEGEWIQEYAPNDWDYERFGTPRHYNMRLK